MKNPARQFYIAYESDQGGGYIASAPAIPGCIVYGKTLREAYQSIQSAIKECLEVRRRYFQKLLTQTHQRDEDFYRRF